MMDKLNIFNAIYTSTKLNTDIINTIEVYLGDNDREPYLDKYDQIMKECKVKGKDKLGYCSYIIDKKLIEKAIGKYIDRGDKWEEFSGDRSYKLSQIELGYSFTNDVIWYLKRESPRLGFSKYKQYELEESTIPIKYHNFIKENCDRIEEKNEFEIVRFVKRKRGSKIFICGNNQKHTKFEVYTAVKRDKITIFCSKCWCKIY